VAVVCRSNGGPSRSRRRVVWGEVEVTEAVSALTVTRRARVRQADSEDGVTVPLSPSLKRGVVARDDRCKSS